MDPPVFVHVSFSNPRFGATQASFGGTSVFSDVIEIAAAYLYRLCANHPFIDGNKRTALAACLVFLKLNGVSTPPDSPAWETLTLDIAASDLDRQQATIRLREILRETIWAERSGEPTEARNLEGRDVLRWGAANGTGLEGPVHDTPWKGALPTLVKWLGGMVFLLPAE